MAGVGVTALDPHAVRLLDERTIAAFLSFLNNQLISNEMQDGETEHQRGAAGEECGAFATNSGMGR